MAEVTVTAAGVDRLAQTLDAASATLADLTETHHDAGTAVLGAARIPVRTGRLASTAVVEVDAIGATVTVGGARAPYAPYVHARTPFLTDALNDRADAVVDLYLGHVRAAVDDIDT